MVIDFSFKIRESDKKNLRGVSRDLYGLGQATTKKLCYSLGCNKNLRFKGPFNSLSKSEFYPIVDILYSKYNLYEADLKRFHFMQIKRLINMKAYKGTRHYYHLPVRGQRTHSNANSYKLVLKLKKSRKYNKKS